MWSVKCKIALFGQFLWSGFKRCYHELAILRNVGVLFLEGERKPWWSIQIVKWETKKTNYYLLLTFSLSNSRQLKWLSAEYVSWNAIYSCHVMRTSKRQFWIRKFVFFMISWSLECFSRTVTLPSFNDSLNWKGHLCFQINDVIFPHLVPFCSTLHCL